MGNPYDPALRKTEHGSLLYQVWKRMRKCDHCEEWDSFPAFYEWAMQNEYEPGEWLRRFNNNEPYSPDNCIWYSTKKEYISDEWKDKWNKTVNVIRKHYGMKPLEGTEYVD